MGGCRGERVSAALGSTPGAASSAAPPPSPRGRVVRQRAQGMPEVVRSNRPANPVGLPEER
eukprot:7700702-Pyramimonas_sp.AAC.1